MASASGSGDEFHSVEKILKERLPADELAHVNRVLYGLNGGAPVASIPVPPAAAALAEAGAWGGGGGDVVGWSWWWWWCPPLTISASSLQRV